MYVLLCKHWTAEHQESSHTTVPGTLLPSACLKTTNTETDVVLYCSLSGLFPESNEFLFISYLKKKVTSYLQPPP